MLSRIQRAALLFLMAAALQAAPPLTAIRDTVHKADGSLFDGFAIFEWKSFEASDTSFIGRNRLQVRITAGVLNVRLVPTTTAASPAYYTVRYVTGGNIQFTEYWAVPPDGNTLRIRDVRISDPLAGPAQAGNLTDIEIADVNGLEEALDQRPSKSAIYTHPRAAILNAEGAIESAAGNPEDCVRVDGTSGPCGSGAGGAVTGTFVDGETPSGAVNGSNNTFSLSAAPNPPSSLLFYRNGVLQKRSLDYALAADSVVFFAGSLPQPGDILLASYRTAGNGGTLPQVLCTGAGLATSATSSTSLGTCNIPANLLRAGDRLDLLFDYSHDGTAVGYQVTVRFGLTPLVSRTAPSTAALVTGRATVGVHATGEQWSVQTWGETLSLATGAGSLAENINADILVDFRGQLSAPTAETVTLRNYTVLRYPAP